MKKALFSISLVGALAVIFTAVMSKDSLTPQANNTEKRSYIVMAASVQQAEQQVIQHQGQVNRSFEVINGVEAILTEEQVSALKKIGLKIAINAKVKLSGSTGWGVASQVSQAVVPYQMGALPMHDAGWYGDGVTIAVLDTGFKSMSGIRQDAYGRKRIYGTYDAINGKVMNNDEEQNGHGTHLASIAGSSDRDVFNRFYGIAPNTRLVSIKAFGETGEGSYAAVIDGIEWAIKRKDQLGIKVLNLSFSAPPQSFYWDDPVNIATMKAWQAGIVVVTSAGNDGNGTDPMNIGVPGNNPYVITVGAATDSYTVGDESDDAVASFSSMGPSVEGFIKPEILGIGGHVTGLMDKNAYLATTRPEDHDGAKYFIMSGTSQAAAAVSGAVALMLQYEPSLTPDEVKCRLMDSASPLNNKETGEPDSIFRQGTGLVNVTDAVLSVATGCANYGLDIEADLAGTGHFVGPVATMGETELQPYLNKLLGDGNFWQDVSLAHNGNFWQDSNLAHNGNFWQDTNLANDGNFWQDSALWHDAVQWDNGSLLYNGNFWQDVALTSDSHLLQETVLLDNSIVTDASLANIDVSVNINVNQWVKHE